MAHYDGAEHVNIGSGAEISIADLARLIARIAGYSGEFMFDSTKPDGTPRKLMDSSRLHALGWKPSFDLETGIAQVVAIIEQSAGQLRTLDLAAGR